MRKSFLRRFFIVAGHLRLSSAFIIAFSADFLHARYPRDTHGVRVGECHPDRGSSFITASPPRLTLDGGLLPGTDHLPEGEEAREVDEARDEERCVEAEEHTHEDSEARFRTLKIRGARFPNML